MASTACAWPQLRAQVFAPPGSSQEEPSPGRDGWGIVPNRHVQLAKCLRPVQRKSIPTMIAATQSNHPLATVSDPVPAGSAMNEARARIRLAGLRITKPRLAIIDALLRRHGPSSTEHIHQEMGARRCDMVTVYRCLAAFEQLGMVRRSYLHNGTCLYELTLGAAARHYHIVCKACGSPERVDYLPVNGIEQLLQDRGYTEVSHVVEFFGICPKCQPATARGVSVTVPADLRA